MLMNDFKKGSEPQYAAGKQVKKGADLTGCLVVGRFTPSLGRSAVTVRSFTAHVHTRMTDRAATPNRTRTCNRTQPSATCGAARTTRRNCATTATGASGG